MKESNHTTLQALGSGIIGAGVLTLLHESARRVIPEAPRMDLLGMQAISKLMHSVNEQPPADGTLHTWALAGDIVSNSLYYSLTGVGKSEHSWVRGSLLGLAAGVGAVLLPGPLGLAKEPSNRTTQTKAMTIAWYFAGGLAAAAAFNLLKRK